MCGLACCKTCQNPSAGVGKNGRCLEYFPNASDARVVQALLFQVLDETDEDKGKFSWRCNKSEGDETQKAEEKTAASV